MRQKSLISVFSSGFSPAWPMIWGGVAVGSAQGISYLAGREMINLSAAVPAFAAWLESLLLPGLHFFSNTFPPEINSVLAGIIAGASAVGLLEAGKRTIIRFSYRMLLTALVGGALFGFGASLAGGDFFYHAVGGVALMQLSSLFIVALSIPIVFLSLEIMSAINTSPMFVPDQQLADKYSLAPALGNARFKAVRQFSSGRYKRNSIVAVIVGVLLLLAALLQERGFSAPAIVAGVLVGAATAMTGFGIEWGLLVPDTVRMPPKYMQQLGLPQPSIDLLRSAFPLQAWLLAMLIAGLTALVYWLAQGAPNGIPAGLSAPGLHIGHVAGAPLLALGSMLMMGSDFRTYSRAGLGYSTAITAILGIIMGNIPFVIWHEDISAWMQSNVISSESWLPRLLPDSTPLRAGVWLLFMIFLTMAIIYVSLRKFKKEQY